MKLKFFFEKFMRRFVEKSFCVSASFGVFFLFIMAMIVLPKSVCKEL